MNTAKEIVEENFKGLDELIKDKDLLLFYKDLIETCMEGYTLEFAKWIDSEYEMTWENDNDEEITTEELCKEWATQSK